MKGEARTCKRVECGRRFLVTSKHKEKQYCRRECAYAEARNDPMRHLSNAERAKYAERRLDGGILPDQDREHLHMARIRLQDAQVAYAARKEGARIEVERQRSYALWGRILGINLEAA